jgi:hypothetical protein
MCVVVPVLVVILTVVAGRAEHPDHHPGHRPVLLADLVPHCAQPGALLREQDFFLAARALGATQRRVILRHDAVGIVAAHGDRDIRGRAGDFA